MEGKQSAQQYIMKAGRKYASDSLVLRAKESLKLNQINTLAASMESAWVHLCGTPNLYGLKSGPEKRI